MTRLRIRRLRVSGLSGAPPSRSEVASAIERHEPHSPQGVTVGPPRSQFSDAARIFAIDVLPVPREPTNR